MEDPEDPRGQNFPFPTHIVVLYLTFIDQLKRVVGSIACWCCPVDLMMNTTSKIDRFSSVRADFLCTNFRAKCSAERRRRPPGLTGGSDMGTWDMARRRLWRIVDDGVLLMNGVLMKILWGSVAYNKMLLTTQVVRSWWWHGSYCPFYVTVQSVIWT